RRLTLREARVGSVSVRLPRHCVWARDATRRPVAVIRSANPSTSEAGGPWTRAVGLSESTPGTDERTRSCGRGREESRRPSPTPAAAKATNSRRPPCRALEQSHHVAEIHRIIDVAHHLGTRVGERGAQRPGHGEHASSLYTTYEKLALRDGTCQGDQPGSRQPTGGREHGAISTEPVSTRSGDTDA